MKASVTAVALAAARRTAGLGRNAGVHGSFGKQARTFAVPAAARASSLASLLALHDSGSTALIAPAQGIKWTYGDLSKRVGNLALGLSGLGYGSGSTIATDLASCAENLLLQLAASHIGASVLTLKSSEDLEKLRSSVKVQGVVATNKDSFLVGLEMPVDTVLVDATSSAQSMAKLYEATGAKDVPAVSTDGGLPLGYYGSAKPVTNAMALAEGSVAQKELGMTGSDVILVSITLNHLFGIGSAVSGALRSGAAVVLPDASGVVGCGNPVQRAQATISQLDALGCTLLFADTHTLKALHAAGEPASMKTLRGGVVKTGSGTTFLDGTVSYAGVVLRTIGKKA
eukprot:TRINITY_DN58118_c0_g1_i1.p1 TRINITY_DN58118_c0_g1~~TRINITY_DN58118_c0_g1_i1.p1  ORF type:complete len:366 (-),score=57.13 TRINITY_DN58118_c0_g1_i1:69-1094(-)